MIGKLGRAQGSEFRDQKRNNLGATWRTFEAAGGLTEKDRGQGSGVRCQRGNVPSVPSVPRFSRFSQVPQVPRFPRFPQVPRFLGS